MTLEEFLALPEDKPAFELIDGEVVQKPVGKRRHSRAQTLIVFLLMTHAATRDGRAWTELGMSFPRGSRSNHRVPDVSYFRPGRMFESDYPGEPADLAVEVRSPGQTVASLQQRLAFLRDQGVPPRCSSTPRRRPSTSTTPGGNGSPAVTTPLSWTGSMAFPSPSPTSSGRSRPLPRESACPFE
jgi:hypothetical protein